MSNDELRARTLAAIPDARLRSLVALLWRTDAEKKADEHARHPASEPQPLRGTRRKQ